MSTHISSLPDCSGGKPSLDAADFLQERLNQHGMIHRQKFMHLKCIQSASVVTHTSVRAGAREDI